MRLIILIILIFTFKANIFALEETRGIKICSQGKSIRIIDGFKVEKDCWSYGYEKTIAFPSKNNCSLLQNDPNCILLSEHNCLLRDTNGNCVNIWRQYSCQMPIVKQKIKKLKLKKPKNHAKKTITQCMNFPAFEPAHKNEVNIELPSTIAKLSTVMQAKLPSDIKQTFDIKNHKVFGGNLMYCNKNMANFSNCCVKGGWGQDILGADCSDDEKNLSQMRDKKLCHYVGKRTDSTLGIPVNTKHYFCCFANSLERIVQTDPKGRIKIKSFGNAETADCTGLTLDELAQIDFNELDFTDFEVDIIQKMKLPNNDDIKNRVKNALEIPLKDYKDSNQTCPYNEQYWHDKTEKNQ